MIMSDFIFLALGFGAFYVFALYARGLTRI